MASFFKKKRQHKVHELLKHDVKPINYNGKTIIAWSKAIDGNDKFLLWLKDNGYNELVMATYAIYLKDEARIWLQKNGYSHLLAMINGAEGNESAQKWLKTHKFNILYHIALSVENRKESSLWLIKNGTEDILMLARSIKKIKDQIEENHNNIHSFRRDL